MEDLTYIQKRYFDILQNTSKEELALKYFRLLMKSNEDQCQIKWLDALSDFYADFDDDSVESFEFQKEIDKLFKEYCETKEKHKKHKDELAFIAKIQNKLNQVK